MLHIMLPGSKTKQKIHCAMKFGLLVAYLEHPHGLLHLHLLMLIIQ